MKSILIIAFFIIGITSFSQVPKSGIYIFKYCDLEYENSCYSTCKVVIKKDSIIIYATKELAEHRTFTEEEDVIDRGILLKHTSGKWIIGKSKKDIHSKKIGVEGPAIIDFKEKKYWTF